MSSTRAFTLSIHSQGSSARTPTPADLSAADIEDVVDHFAQQENLMASPDLDTLHDLMEQRFNGRVSFVTDTEGKPEIAVRPNGDFVINVPKHAPKWRQREVLAHEIGHYVLHSQMGRKPITLGYEDEDGANLSEDHKTVEWEARAFAMALLMPKKEFKRELRKTRMLSKTSEKFGVSYQAARSRALMLKFEI